MSPAIRRRKATAKVMQDSADDKMSCFVVVVAAPVSLQEFISGRDWAGEEGRGGGGGDRGAVFRPGGKVAGALTA